MTDRISHAEILCGRVRNRGDVLLLHLILVRTRFSVRDENINTSQSIHIELVF